MTVDAVGHECFTFFADCFDTYVPKLSAMYVKLSCVFSVTKSLRSEQGTCRDAEHLYRLISYSWGILKYSIKLSL